MRMSQRQPLKLDRETNRTEIANCIEKERERERELANCRERILRCFDEMREKNKGEVI
jgi:hypothetical protein